jgi:hypothetical protein
VVKTTYLRRECPGKAHFSHKEQTQACATHSALRPTGRWPITSLPQFRTASRGLQNTGLNVFISRIRFKSKNEMPKLFEPCAAPSVGFFSRQQTMRTLGIEIADLRAGEIELRMPHLPAYAQQHGFTHAGIIAAALDSSCGYAAFSLMPEDGCGSYSRIQDKSDRAGQGRILPVPSTCGEARPDHHGLR